MSRLLNPNRPSILHDFAEGLPSSPRFGAAILLRATVQPKERVLNFSIRQFNSLTVTPAEDASLIRASFERSVAWSGWVGPRCSLAPHERSRGVQARPLGKPDRQLYVGPLDRTPTGLVTLRTDVLGPTGKDGQREIAQILPEQLGPLEGALGALAQEIGLGPDAQTMFSYGTVAMMGTTSTIR